MEGGDARTHELVVAGRILLSKRYPNTWLASAASQRILAEHHNLARKTISKIGKSLAADDSHANSLAIQAAMRFYAKHRLYRQSFEGLIK
jgi:hypothetical protein